MKFIFKNIWVHRGLNLWLFIEIVVIAVLTWLFGGSMTRNIYYAINNSIYMKIDPDNTLNTYIAQWVMDGEQEPSIEEKVKNSKVVIEKLREEEDFKSVSINPSRSINTAGRYANAESHMITNAYIHPIITEGNYFTTCNIASLNNSFERLEEIADGMGDDDIIITESLAEALFGTTDVVGRSIYEHDADKYVHPDSMAMGRRYNIVDVVEKNLDNMNEIFGYNVYTKTNIESLISMGTIWLTIRLRDGLTVEEFLAKRNMEEDRTRFHAGNSGLVQFMKYEENQSFNYELVNEIFTIFLSLFFLDMFIGIAGTFWLQIRNRFEDISIQRSFGASRRRVIRSIIVEGMVLAQIAIFVGCIIILQFSDSLIAPLSPYCSTGYETNWMTNFWPHFFIVTMVTSVVIQIFVVIGVLIPAYFHTRKLLK